MLRPFSDRRDPFGLKRDQVWRREVVAELGAELEREVSSLLESGGLPAACAELFDRFETAALEPSLTAQLRAVLHARAGLRLAAQGGGLTLAQLVAAHRRASSILERHQVDPRSSRLAFLHHDLDAALAVAIRNDGDVWRSAWLARGGGTGPLLHDAEQHLFAGLADEAVGRLLAVELQDLPLSDRVRLQLARARLLRLGARSDEAASLLNAQAHGADERCAGMYSFERASLDAARLGSPQPLFQLLRRERALRSPERWLVLRLWGHAVQSKEWHRRSPTASSLRRKGREQVDSAALACAIALDACVDAAGSLATRLEHLGRTLEGVPSIENVELELLVWMASARFLHRSKQRSRAALALARYRTLSSRLSGGRSEDVLGAAADLLAKPQLATPQHPVEVAPPSVVERSARLATLAGRMAFAHARRWMGARDSSSSLDDYVAALAPHLGVLKGPLMKLGQVLGLYGFDLPDEALDLLRGLHDSSPPIATEHVERTVENELGAPLSRHFRAFSERPIATGSIGQVHAAVLLDGTHVAVKVQYPGIERAIRMDLRALALVKPLLREVFPRWDLDALVDEVRQQLLAECDYRREAEHQAHFHAQLVDDPHLGVPAVIPQLSTRRVLTSQFVDGLTFDELLAKGSRAQLDQVGESLTRFVVRTTVGDRFFNSDIQPGNVLVSDRRVWVVDFGNVRRWNPKEGTGFRTLLEALLARNPLQFGRAFVDLGLVAAASDLDFGRAYDLMMNQGRILPRLVEDRRQRFRRDDVKADLALWIAPHPDAKAVLLPAPYLFAFRAYWGSCAMLARMEAEANWRQVIRGALDA